MTPRQHAPTAGSWFFQIFRVLTQNLYWKLLALAIAIGAWLAVSSEPELATIISMPVEYRNYPKDFEISSDIVSTINVEAKGPAGRLASLHETRNAAVIDFSSVNAPGERTFTLTASALNLPRGVELIRTVPSQLRFNFERRLTRMLPVDVPLSGHLREGLVLDSVDVTPQQLQVGGPENHVLQAEKLMADPLDLTNVTSTVEQTVAVYASDPEVRLLSKPQVTVKIHVRQAQ